MNDSVEEITFDNNGNCNFCNEFMASFASKGLGEPNSLGIQEKLAGLILEIQRDGKNRPYDCIVGVSGGVDSSWVLVKAVSLGLRPLAVHMDNGWNSNLAVSNISNLIDKLGVDLHTYVINWDEYRSLMEAFFAADVIDIELLYDNALHEVCYSQAEKYGLKYILSGSNFSTEGLRMPGSWNWESKFDGRNIVRISRHHGAKVRTFPLFTTLKWLKYTYLARIKWVPFLDLLDYEKEPALAVLESQYSYARYPYKHYESVFTRFYQGFLLPKKFGVDKRLVHLSTLVVSGQMSRSQALQDLRTPPYPSEREQRVDLQFFLKKMGWSEQKLAEYLERPQVSHSSFGTDLTRTFVIPITRTIGGIINFLRHLPQRIFK